MAEAPPQRRQLVCYSFYKVSPEWRRLPAEVRTQHKSAFLRRLDEIDPETMVRGYSTVGLRGDVDFLLWKASYELDALQDAATAVASTELGAYLTVAHNFLAMTRRSTYVDRHSHAGQEGRRTTVRPSGGKYFFVYPFVKSHAWYQLPFAERQRMMDEHIKVGHEFPSVRINTSYSFGLDDQDFVVAFETDRPADFLDLVMKLREAEQRPYTERDTPIFTCISMPLEQVLETFGG